MINGRKAGEAPIGVNVLEGKSYYWCTCGLSVKQPFCDGSHKDTAFNTFPDNSDWIKFRKNKGRFAEWENLFKNLNHSR